MRIFNFFNNNKLFNPKAFINKRIADAIWFAIKD